MATKKKPFRTLLPGPPPDHFTRAQARDAVLAVMAERGETPRLDPTATWPYVDGWAPTPEMFER
jgi:hypothetical protein